MALRSSEGLAAVLADAAADPVSLGLIMFVAGLLSALVCMFIRRR
jgi:hypothetical protein